jgi:1,2-diacylglycerol 3-beta-galactosyltransferase
MKSHRPPQGEPIRRAPRALWRAGPGSADEEHRAGSTRQRKVLILLADTGSGHRSVAKAISKAIAMEAAVPPAESARESSACTSLVVNAFSACGRLPLRTAVRLYGPAIKHSPGLFGNLYHMTDTAAGFQVAYRIASPLMRQGLRRYLAATQPDIIVSVHAMLNHVTLDAVRQLRVAVPVVSVVTDLITVHRAWFAPGVTSCIVPTEEACQVATAMGVAADRVHLLGMPVDPAFAQTTYSSRAAVRAELGLNPALPTVLLVGGGDGAMGLARAVMALGKSHLTIQMIVVTGRNKAILAQLQRDCHQLRVPTHLLGFVDNMPALMHAADCIVTKAGSATIAEALACGLPIVLMGAIPGQEEGNIDLVVKQGAGVLARSARDVVHGVNAILRLDGARLEAMRTSARRLSRRDASAEVARHILRHLPAPGEPSAWERAAVQSVP